MDAPKTICECGKENNTWFIKCEDCRKAGTIHEVGLKNMVMVFAKPTISDEDFNKWLNNKTFYAEQEGINLNKYLLREYLYAVEQFMNSSESKATKAVLEVVTQTIKKYLEQKA